MINRKDILMEQIKKREEIDDLYKWDLNKIYNSKKQIENDIAK